MTGLIIPSVGRIPISYSQIIMDNEKKKSPAKVSKPSKEVKETKQPPVFRAEFSGISAAVWPKQTPSANGHPRETWMVSLTRSYQIGNETKRTHILFPEHLLPASIALKKAWEFIETGSKPKEKSNA